MESVTSDWNLERLANEESRQRAEEQGSFNSMDGRYHQSETRRDLLKQQHIERTFDRAICRYYKRGWCKNGYGCTLRHYGARKRSRYDNGDRSEDEEDMFQKHYVSKRQKRDLEWKMNEVIHQHKKRKYEDYIYHHFSTARNPDPRSSTARSSRD